MKDKFIIKDSNDNEDDILNVEIRCVLPPDDKQLVEIGKFLKDKYNNDNISFTIVKDPSVIGGFSIFVRDDNYDFTTLSRIRSLKQSFDNISKDATAENIISLLKEKIEDFSPDTQNKQVGFVVSVIDSIAVIKGLSNVTYGEIVCFESGIKGMVQDIRADGHIGVILFGDCSEISQGTRVLRTKRTAGIAIGKKMLGRIVNPLGAPLDGGDDISSAEFYPIERPAPGIIDRESVTRPLETGILAIDSMFPIGRGQRELIIGNRQTGKTSVAIDTIINQKGKNIVCVYVAIGQKASSVAKVVNTLQKADAMSYTVIVSSPADDPASLQYIAPYSGCSIAEYFMYHGYDTLIVYDDLSKHAVAYRTLSLLLERSPGREAYPGDVFYLHSRLLERSAQLSGKCGGKSMTALPIVETLDGDVSAYIPTNIISITDGQIFLESDLFFSGQRPAVNVGLSVSRVGGSAQTPIMKKAVGSIRLDLAQYREMQVFAQFGSDLDESTKKQIRYGAGLMQLLKQKNNSPLSMWQQVVTLFAAKEKLFTDIPEKSIKDAHIKMLTYFEEHNNALCHNIEINKIYTDEIKAKIIETAKEFIDSYKNAL